MGFKILKTPSNPPRATGMGFKILKTPSNPKGYRSVCPLVGGHCGLVDGWTGDLLGTTRSCRYTLPGLAPSRTRGRPETPPRCRPETLHLGRWTSLSLGLPETRRRGRRLGLSLGLSLCLSPSRLSGQPETLRLCSFLCSFLLCAFVGSFVGSFLWSFLFFLWLRKIWFYQKPSPAGGRA